MKNIVKEIFKGAIITVMVMSIVFLISFFLGSFVEFGKPLQWWALNTKMACIVPTALCGGITIFVCAALSPLNPENKK